MAKKVLIMAGGTGGHIFPALAVAHALKKKQVDVIWLGTQKGLEAQIIPKEDIPLFFITVSGLRKKGFFRFLLAPFQIIRALLQALKIIYQNQPDVVLGMGGFASGPGGIAGWLLRRPLVIHEQNAMMGMTNKILSHFATQVLTGFPFRRTEDGGRRTDREGRGIDYVGNPVRENIIQVGKRRGRRSAPRRTSRLMPPPTETFNLLVLGGSQGASCFNEIIPKAITKLCKDRSRPVLTISVWHQTGKHDFEKTKKRYEWCQTPFGISEYRNVSDAIAKVEAFIEDMAKAYEWADLIICRAGALTIAEITAAGMPSILVPYPHAVDDHQTVNAQCLADQGAAVLIPQNQLHETKLIEVLLNFMSNPALLLKIGEKAYKLRKIDATAQIVNRLLKL
ncbi:MAG: undecaprenyldiphospho-muramoylpentapeptide beta-N-acetylglucosaminyltransferase [Gammaproteobacteria bacterium]|nr:undecaprenyldiphospho-muramoylpentapeptide beta-N-acetylglucosaminyltransferase [Gammaproteobacteria bacterium]